ncbi:MAG: 30S ribosomal protein S9 [Bacteroidetes bacterium]|nr:MAG: 30S ribosomal protein S9 [Bacteroidota bacterium]
MEIINAVGRRKKAIARVYLTPGAGNITVNNRKFDEYFTVEMARKNALSPFTVTNTMGQFDLKVRLTGGGMSGQSDALKLGIARALNEVNQEEYRPVLKENGMLRRDARMVERKKPGRKKARKKFQFSKR